MSAGQNALAQTGRLDPVFASVPFAQWLNDKPDAGPFHWSARVDIAELSRYQRIQGGIEIRVDGIDLVKRREHGSLLLLFQLTTANGAVFQDHHALELRDVNDATAKSDITYSQPIFLLPGEYRAAFAIFDKVSDEHAVIQRTFRVNALKNEVLPNAWALLPAVEFSREVKPPDDLLTPYLSPLSLPVKVQRPVELDILVNTASTPASAPLRRRITIRDDSQLNESRAPSDRNLRDVMAAMKVLAAINLQGGAVALSLIDVVRQKPLFDQRLWHNEQAEPLDLPQLRTALIATDPNKIDVRSIETRAEAAKFFLEQIRKRITIEPSPGDPPRALIILSGPLELPRQDRQQLLENVKPGTAVFFVRYHSPAPPRPITPEMALYQNHSQDAPPAWLEPLDALGPLLKPLRPKVFDIFSPDQFRKAVAAILADLAKL